MDFLENDEALRLENQLCFALYSSSRFVTRAYVPLLERHQLTYPQYLVLLVLWEEDQQTVNQIGQKLYLDSGTLTPLLKRMQTAGYIARVRSHDDERKVIVALTDKGRNLRQEAVAIPQSLFQQSRLDLQELIDLKKRLEQLIDAFQQQPPAGLE